MRILQVISYFYPAWAYGGPPRSAYELSKELVRRGHEVTVYTTDSLDPKHRVKVSLQGKASVIDGIDVYYFKNLSNWLAGRHHLFLPFSLVKALHDHLGEFDIVHLHDARTTLHIPAHYYARKYAIPYVLQARGSAPRLRAKRRLKQVYDILWGYKLLRDASKVIALTETEVDQYKDMGISEDKIEIVPNGINPSEFENLPGRGAFRRKHGLSDEQKIILYLGRIHRIKGIDLLAKAFAGLSNELNDTRLVIAGPDDGYLPELKRMIPELKIEEKVLFTGPIYGEEKMAAYVDADVYVLPSIYETFPNTVLEAFACGTPVILTDRCGIADIVNGQGGVVVPYDKDQLQMALLYMLSDEKMRQESGECGKLLVRGQFNWEKITEQVEDIYLRCLSSRS